VSKLKQKFVSEIFARTAMLTFFCLATRFMGQLSVQNGLFIFEHTFTPDFLAVCAFAAQQVAFR